ncbi:MAG: elongation factor 4 [Candidatus Wildermuthbacteria bacterium]|nr:elongation factor 4 [Candidatus Wildermuthbacteria bacterium]
MSNIRNFCIIAHIDHGKSTLADRFLELTGTIERRKMREQFLDQMELEREKGITIKMQPVRMSYRSDPASAEASAGRQSDGSDGTYALNLIDTPGHADFSYEVSRGMAAVEGAILLVDATKGIQAQTLAHLHHAQEQRLFIIPVVNKIDSPLARTQEAAKELADLLGIDAAAIHFVSAKEGTNVEKLLQAVGEKVPPPAGSLEKPFRALIFGSRFDTFKGVVAFVRVKDGQIKPNEKVSFLGTGVEAIAQEVGYFSPQEVSQQELKAGEIGYIATGVKDPAHIRIGDTIVKTQSSVEALAGFQIPRPVVFVSLYPQDPNEFDALKDALSKLRLNDPSFTYEVEAKEALGRGFRCGFLGVLHSEIISERIRREFKIEMVISRPSVEFDVTLKNGNTISVKTPADWPQGGIVQSIKEPWILLEAITPREFFSRTTQFLQGVEGTNLQAQDLGGEKFLLKYEMPLREMVSGLYEKLKSVTEGMASMDYKFLDERPADLVKLEFRIAGQVEEALATIVPQRRAYQEGKTIVEKLKDLVPPQQFEVAIQAVAEGRVIARETIKARRRDVTAPLYGGDVTRKRKLLEIQKKGKKELKAKGRVTIPSKVFLDIFRA